MSYGRIPDEVIEGVLKHHDIVDVVGKYVHLTKQGQRMTGLCPFHSEKSPSFSVNPGNQLYYCFGCKASGNLIRFVMEIEGYTFPEAVMQLAEEAQLDYEWEVPDEAKSKDQQEKSILYQAYEFTAKLYHHILLNTEQGKPALEYLRSRGVTDKWIEQFQLGYAPTMWDRLVQLLEKREYPLPLMEKGGLISAKSDGTGYLDKFRDRVIFPIHDPKGRVIAFGGRLMGEGQPKYLNSPETILFNKSRSLFNYHRARPAIRKSGQVVLFEGYMDTLKAWGAGIENGVATMGTSLTEDHADFIRRHADQVIVCYDGDQAGQNAAYKSIGILNKAGIPAGIALLPDGMDPDEYIGRYGASRFRKEIIEGALTSVQYKIRYARRNFNLNNETGIRTYIETAVKIIAEVNSPLEREQYVKELAREFQEYEFETINQQLNTYRQEYLNKRDIRDNKDKSWNNVMNNGKGREKKPSLLPRYHTAEIQLLAVMMHDREVAEHVRQQLGEQFNIETHAALAAYLYAFYAQGNEPDASRYLAALQDERLESAAGQILMTDTVQGTNPQVIDDYIREIKKHPQLEAIKHKKEEMIRAERAGEIALAAQMASEILTLERQLKAL
ncbi:DNA primase [Paenibacillus aurantius]|uniref:DNA primase n=1 Tax=Paenibacillus aurantius TaxID=2918900 RepID=A0AA96LLF2_9BACL|nr:DNA primase [Paenibacillus aurantius]WJH33042.1 DNA primase [Paenibacillus sp. CC-CFT747]WNQ13472.1 DNA primase [Paenibacillus aurantius]